MDDRVLINIGKKIREMRQQRNLKLNELAEEAQITKGMLSKIENGRTIPSLPVLLSVIQALKLDLKAFFEGIDLSEKEFYIHKKAIDYQKIQKEDSPGFAYQLMLTQNTSHFVIETMILELAPQTQRAVLTTDGYEFKYILSGQITYQLGNERITLDKGDSLFFDGQTPHTPMNLTNESASMLVIYIFLPKDAD
ncbi:MAG: XRE family transcriptional regulator [Microscillaceae bacterium]|jgi:transcriptional regulator with XRE-family HTH domain|nr:XRE family transcriptional regulator [Microscillaceae bacterium]